MTDPNIQYFPHEPFYVLSVTKSSTTPATADKNYGIFARTIIQGMTTLDALTLYNSIPRLTSSPEELGAAFAKGLDRSATIPDNIHVALIQQRGFSFAEPVTFPEYIANGSLVRRYAPLDSDEELLFWLGFQYKRPDF